MIRLIYNLSVIIGGSTKISITLGGSSRIVAVRGEGTSDLQDRWIRSTPSNQIREKYFPDAKNRYHQFVNGPLYYQAWENSLRIQYLFFVKNFLVPTTELAGIKTIAKIALGIFEVNISLDLKKRHYIFKSFKKPFYKLMDTKIL